MATKWLVHKSGCVSAPFCDCALERVAELEAKLAEQAQATAKARAMAHAAGEDADEARLGREQAEKHIRELEAKLAEAERSAAKFAALVITERASFFRAESREKALREALTHAVAWFWGAEPEGTVAARDRVAAEFYAETGFIAPGKDVPPVMNPSWTEEERRAAWDVWVKRKRDALEAECRAALAAGRKTGSECVNGCHKPVCPPSRVLCADCFAELDRKMQALAAGKETP